jgi:hypothetical protein
MQGLWPGRFISLRKSGCSFVLANFDACLRLSKRVAAICWNRRHWAGLNDTSVPPLSAALVVVLCWGTIVSARCSKQKTYGSA